jgi:hypothetical protein
METKLIWRKVLGVVAAVALAVVSLGVLPVPHAAADPRPGGHTPPLILTPADVHVHDRACYYEKGKLLYCEEGTDPIVAPAHKPAVAVA